MENIFVYEADSYTFWCLGKPTGYQKGFPSPIGCIAHVMYDYWKDYVWGYSYQLDQYFFLGNDPEQIDQAIALMIRYHQEPHNETKTLL